MKNLKSILVMVGFMVMAISARAQTDPLSTWTLVFTNPIVQINSIAYGNGTFVGVGGGMRYFSNNGSNWVGHVSPPILNQAYVAYGGGMFLTFGTNTQSPFTVVYASTNGTIWKSVYTNANALTAVAYGNNSWVLIGPNDNVTATVNSNVLSWSEYVPDYTPNAVIFANGGFIQVANDAGSPILLTSADGYDWQFAGYIDLPHVQAGGASIAFGNGIYIVTCIDQYNFNRPNTYFCTSTNLTQWNVLTGSTVGPSSATSVEFVNNEFLASVWPQYGPYSYGGFVSSDGIRWTPVYWGIGTAANYGAMAGAAGQGYMVLASLNGIYESGLISMPTNQTTTTLGIASYPGVTINGTAGMTYQIQFSSNVNTNWTTATNITLPYTPYVWVDTSTTMTGQRFYRSVLLQ